MIKKEPPIYYEEYQGWKHSSRLPGPNYRWWQLFHWLTSVSSNLSGPQFLSHRIVMRIQWAEEYRMHTPTGIHTNAIIIYTNIIHQCYYSSKENEEGILSPRLTSPSLKLCSSSHRSHWQSPTSSLLSRLTLRRPLNDIPLIKEAWHTWTNTVSGDVRLSGNECRESFKGWVWGLWYCIGTGRTPDRYKSMLKMKGQTSAWERWVKNAVPPAFRKYQNFFQICRKGPQRPEWSDLSIRQNSIFLT